MAIDFPASPSVNDIHTSGGKRWTWNGTSWERSGTPGPGDTISATNDNTTSTLYPVLVTGTGSNTAKLATTASKSVSFNASNGNLTATTFTGTLNTAAQTNITSVGTLGSLNVTGNATIGGVLTYEDVKNVDSVGIITARSGIDCNGTLEVSSTSNFDGTVKVAGDIEHLGDDDTKIVFTDNQIDLQTGGYSRVYATNSGIFVRSGTNLGFLAATGPSPAIKSGGTNNQDLLLTTGTSNPTRLCITSGGPIGVGNENPQVQYFNNFVVGNNVSGDKGITIRSNSDSSGILAFSDTDVGDANRYDGYIRYSHITQHMAFYTAGANERLRINSSGNVGIGTDNPETRLHVSDGHLASADNFDSNIVLAVSKNAATSDWAGIALNSGNAAGAFIHFGDTDDSNVGRLDYDHTANSFKFFTNGNATERLSITSAGNVTTTGNSTFSRGDAGFTARKGDCVSVTRDNGTPLEITRTTAQGNMINFFDTDATTQRANIQLNSNDLVFGLTGERLRITSGGIVRIKRTASTTLDNDTIYLALGDTENGANSNRMIGFGYVATLGTSVYPASIGYTETDNSSNTKGALVFNTRNTTGATDTPTERLRINSDGRVNIANSNQTGSHLDYTRLNVYGITSNGGTNKNLNLLNVYNYGSGNVGDITGIGLGAGASPGGYTKASIGFIRTGTYGRGDLIFCINDQGNANQVVEGNERLRIHSGGTVEANTSISSTYSATTNITPHLRVRNKNGTDNIYGGIELRADRGNGAAAMFNIACLNSSTNYASTLVFQSRKTDGNFDERLRIASDGKVAIGGNYTNTSTFGRQVLIDGTLGLNNDSGNVGMGFHSGTSNCYGYIGTGDWAVTGGTTEDFGIAAKGNLIFGTSSGGWSEKLRITDDGKVGINDSNPTAQLVVKATTDDNPGVMLYRQSTGGDIASIIWETGSGTQAKINYRGAAGANEGLQFYTAGGSSSQLRMIIDHSGNIGVGNNDPAEKIDVSGSVQASGGFKTAGHPIATYASFTDISGGSYATRLGSTGTSTLRSTQIYGGGSHIATFDGVNKRLGINVTAPSERLDVRDGDIILSSTNAGNAHRTSFIEFTGSYAKIISEAGLGSDGSSNYASGWKFTTRNYTGSAFETRTPLAIHANGDVKISDGNLIIGGATHGISFINATDNATGETVQSSLIDDYEEGTFTPTWYTESSLISVNYHTQKGFYQKIGRMVYFQVYIRINSRSGGSGNMAIYGLPYIPQDATTHPNVAYGGLNVAYTNSWVGDKVERGLVSSAAGKCYVYLGTSGGTNVNAGAGNLGNGTQFRAYGSYITA